MLKRLRDGNFALGLVIGGGLVLLLCLILGSGKPAVEQPISENHNANSQINAARDKQADNQSLIEIIVRQYLSKEDTLVQWIMMAFTVGAFILIWRILKVTRDALETTRNMAIDQSRIGEAQTRAYLSVEKINVIHFDKFGSDREAFGVSAEIKNTGPSPARYVVLDFQMYGYFDFPGANNNFTGKLSVQNVVAKHTQESACSPFGLGASPHVAFKNESVLVWQCDTILSWEDVFGELNKETQRFSIRMKPLSGGIVSECTVWPGAADDRKIRHLKRKDKQ